MIDRGKAKYFHGRKKEIGLFQKLLDEAKAFQTGTTFLIQGAPGVGKTTLLERCMEIAEKQGWEVVEIEPDGLWNREALEKYMGIDKNYQDIERKREGKADLHFLGGKQETTYKKTELSIPEILSSRKTPLLFVLDEAQEMKDIHREPFSALRTAKTVLKKIHNGKCHRPVIFLADGLGMTKSVFESFGLSRLSVASIIDLQKLDALSERAIITDWLVKEGKAKGDSTYWVDEITNHTYGWGQHITSYGEVAAEELKKNNGVFTKRGLINVLIEGEQRRNQYYQGRFHGIGINEREIIAKIIQNGLEQLADVDIIAVFKEKFNEEKSNKLFEKIVFKGIFHMNDDGQYAVPILSMKNWLLSKLKDVKKKTSKKETYLRWHDNPQSKEDF